MGLRVVVDFFCSLVLKSVSSERTETHLWHLSYVGN